MFFCALRRGSLDLGTSISKGLHSNMFAMWPGAFTGLDKWDKGLEGSLEVIR